MDKNKLLKYIQTIDERDEIDRKTISDYEYDYLKAFNDSITRTGQLGFSNQFKFDHNFNSSEESKFSKNY